MKKVTLMSDGGRKEMERTLYPKAYDYIKEYYNYSDEQMKALDKYTIENDVAMYESSVGIIKLVGFESQPVILESGEEVLSKDYPIHEGDTSFEQAVIRSWKKNGIINYSPTSEEYRRLLIADTLEYNQ